MSYTVVLPYGISHPDNSSFYSGCHFLQKRPILTERAHGKIITGTDHLVMMNGSNVRNDYSCLNNLIEFNDLLFFIEVFI
jgi:hypothetical protein